MAQRADQVGSVRGTASSPKRTTPTKFGCRAGLAWPQDCALLGASSSPKRTTLPSLAVKVLKGLAWPSGPQDCAQLRPGLAVIGGGHGGLEFTKENHSTKFGCSGWARGALFNQRDLPRLPRLPHRLAGRFGWLASGLRRAEAPLGSVWGGHEPLHSTIRKGVIKVP